MFSRRNLISGLAASVAPASVIERTTEPPALAEDEPTKEARRAVRQRLAGEIEYFIDFASAEDAWLMERVLIEWGSISLCKGPEVSLGTAFELSLGRDEAYVKVDYGLRRQVAAIIKKLAPLEGNPAAKKLLLKLVEFCADANSSEVEYMDHLIDERRQIIKEYPSEPLPLVEAAALTAMTCQVTEPSEGGGVGALLPRRRVFNERKRCCCSPMIMSP